MKTTKLIKALSLLTLASLVSACASSGAFMDGFARGYNGGYNNSYQSQPSYQAPKRTVSCYSTNSFGSVQTTCY